MILRCEVDCSDGADVLESHFIIQGIVVLGSDFDVSWIVPIGSDWCQFTSGCGSVGSVSREEK